MRIDAFRRRQAFRVFESQVMPTATVDGHRIGRLFVTGAKLWWVYGDIFDSIR
jgi:hypothetical protein